MVHPHQKSNIVACLIQSQGQPATEGHSHKSKMIFKNQVNYISAIYTEVPPVSCWFACMFEVVLKHFLKCFVCTDGCEAASASRSTLRNEHTFFGGKTSYNFNSIDCVCKYNMI